MAALLAHLRRFLPLLAWLSSLALSVAVHASPAPSPLVPTRLRADGAACGPGAPAFLCHAVRSRTPHLTWAPRSETRGAAQEAFDVRVYDATSGKRVWASGPVQSNEPSTDVVPPLVEGRRYQWDVAVLVDNTWSHYSAKSAFHVPLLSQDAWDDAVWLGDDSVNLYRATFAVPPDAPKLATLSIAGLAFASVRVNGVDVPDHFLTTSPWTNYDKIVGFETLEIGSMLKSNTTNTVEVTLGEGWRGAKFPERDPDDPRPYSQDPVRRVLRAQLHLGDGRVLSKTGDKTWEAAAGPILADSLYDGEWYDARLVGHEQWRPTTKLNASSTPFGIMVPYAAPNIAVVETVPAESIAHPYPQWYVVDFGVNLAGVTELVNVKCKRGTNITLIHAEIMQHDGIPSLPHMDPKMPYTSNLRFATQTDTYTCRGDAAGETWHPTTTQHGFRYVLVNVSDSGFEPATEHFRLLHIHSAMPQRTNVSFSSPTLNRIQALALGTMRSNTMTVVTDCPQRDERLGWLGDKGISVDSVMRNFDATAFYAFDVANMASEVNATDGSLSDVVPDLGAFGYERPGDPTWTSAIAKTAYAVHELGGDLRPARDHLDKLVAHVGNVEAQAKAAGGVAKMKTLYGDWVPPPPTLASGRGPGPSGPYTSGFSYYVIVRDVARLAHAIGDKELGGKLDSLAESVLDEFTKAWASPDGCFDACSTQTALVLAIACGAARKAGVENATLAHLNTAIQKAGLDFTTGILGFRYLFEVLGNHGMADVALSMLEETDYPSVGFQFANSLEPATANVWEVFNAPVEIPEMDSRNHHAFSSFSAYLITHVAGLRVEQESVPPHFTMAVATTAGLSAASAKTDTPRGTVSLRWRATGGVHTSRVAAGIGDHATIDCGPGGGVVESVSFASFGTPEVSHHDERIGRPTFTEHPICHAADSADVAVARCKGRRRCAVPADAAAFAALPEACLDDVANPPRLWVQATCTGPPGIRASVRVPVGASADVNFPTTRLAASSDGRISAWTLSESGTKMATLFREGMRLARTAEKLPRGVASVRTDPSSVSVRVLGGTFSFVLRPSEQ